MDSQADIARLKELFDNGEARAQVEDMIRRELEFAYLDLLGKYIEVAERIYQRHSLN